ncbi:MAG: diaminopimelate epimerase, partial [Rickettsiales bacterium]
MDGAGNDFVIIDNRSGAYRFSEAEITHMADRHQGIGCDQLVLLETSEVASVFMRLYNADGGEVGACGNATRCVAWLVEETGETTASIETVSGMLYCERAGEMAVTVNMGEPGLDWRQIPLKEEANTADMRLQVLPLEGGVAVNMGNPHIVFFVDSIADIPLGEVGPKLEHDPIFPERTNVEVVEIHSPTKLAM